MAKFVLNDPYLTINAVDFTDYANSVSLEVSTDLQESTVFGPDGYRTRIGGLKDWTLTMDFRQDFDAAALDATVWGLLGTSVPMVLRGDSGARGADNPEYGGNLILESYPILGNAVGEIAGGSLTFQGNGALTRTV